ncbi:L-tyrosine/L-tryptophan isonitrile synthase family protein [Allokutzneria albata]|uniref:L-tyrosine/L-tryptophan isonitrile synthase family protein n=1 Tax=Allokutzneria albata TaxID=211114 RepID=UPI0009F557E6|nr:L-tyrosine/L-tryptophan isonitrile synthase family protein [Allokutzneria albata]
MPVNRAVAELLDDTGRIRFDPRSVMVSPKAAAPLFPPLPLEDFPAHQGRGRTEEIDYAALAAQVRAGADDFLRSCWGRLRAIDDPARRVFEIMAAARYRAGSVEGTAFADNWGLWRGRLSQAVRDNAPIPIVLPSFPFKAPNPLKVRRRLPDMAELLCLMRLFEITQAIQAVHPAGAVFHILSESRIYAPLFEVSVHEAQVYRSEVDRMIGMLGAGGALRTVDILDEVIAPRQEDFDAVRDALEPELRQWWRDNADDAHRRYLVRNFIASVHAGNETAQLLANLLNTALTNDVIDAGDELARVRRKIEQRADQAAFTYTLLLCTLKLTDVMGKYAPGAIRATVHPKPGQWGIHLVNKKSSIYPWHGVAVRKPSGSWRVRTELDAIRSGAIPVRTGAYAMPFFYEEQ